MSKKVVLLFAGQGAQKVGMGKDLQQSGCDVKTGALIRRPANFHAWLQASTRRGAIS